MSPHALTPSAETFDAWNCEIIGAVRWCFSGQSKTAPALAEGAHGDPNRGRSDQRAEIVRTISYGRAGMEELRIVSASQRRLACLSRRAATTPEEASLVVR
jgi:hypothetical protein